MHNLHFYGELAREARRAIEEGRFGQFSNPPGAADIVMGRIVRVEGSTSALRLSGAAGHCHCTPLVIGCGQAARELWRSKVQM